MSKALQLCKAWIESDEGRSIDNIVELEDKANAMGTKAWNEDFVAMCRAVKAELAAPPEVDANLVAEINTVWIHGCCQGHGEPVDDVATLTKRVRWIGSQLDCAQTNFRVTNAAYCKLDEETRALRSPQKPTT